MAYSPFSFFFSPRYTVFLYPKGIVGVAHNDEQGGLAITQGVQLQLVISGQITQFLDVEGSQPCAAGNEDGFCRLA